MCNNRGARQATKPAFPRSFAIRILNATRNVDPGHEWGRRKVHYKDPSSLDFPPTYIDVRSWQAESNRTGLLDTVPGKETLTIQVPRG